MAIVGGALMPPVQGAIIDLGRVGPLPAENASFILPFISFCVVAIYGRRTYLALNPENSNDLFRKNTTMKRLCFLIAVALLLFSCQPAEKSHELPNIVVVLADDLGYGDLSCFNPDGKILTPHFDQNGTLDGIGS